MTARGLFAVRNVVAPFDIVVVLAALDFHPEILAEWMKRKALRIARHRGRKKFFGAGVGLGRRMETAPLDIRSEDDAHRLKHVILPGVNAANLQPRGVFTLRERNLESECRVLAHPAWHDKIPARETPRGIGGELRNAPRVKLPRIALILQPATHARPDIDSIRRTPRIRIRGENRIVLAVDFTPADSQLRCGAGSIR